MGFLKRHDMVNSMMMAAVTMSAVSDVDPASGHGAFFCGLCMWAVTMPCGVSEHRKHCPLRLNQPLRDWTLKRTVGL